MNTFRKDESGDSELEILVGGGSFELDGELARMLGAIPFNGSIIRNSPVMATDKKFVFASATGSWARTVIPDNYVMLDAQSVDGSGKYLMFLEEPKITPYDGQNNYKITCSRGWLVSSQSDKNIYRHVRYVSPTGSGVFTSDRVYRQFDQNEYDFLMENL